MHIHLGGLVVIQLLPDVCFILKQQGLNCPLDQKNIRCTYLSKDQSINHQCWNFHLWCKPSPRLVRASVVFVARCHFDIVVELDYLNKYDDIYVVDSTSI